MNMEAGFTAIAIGFEVIGAFIIVIGFLIAIVLAIRAIARGEASKVAFATLRSTLGGGILLGLELLVAADLVRTITAKPSIEDAVILGIIVVIRTILSMSIQIEIDGVLPWRRALLTSGAQVVAGQIAKDRAATRRDEQ